VTVPTPQGLCPLCWERNVAANIGGMTCRHTPAQIAAYGKPSEQESVIDLGDTPPTEEDISL
jgi:hypothetical protein